MWIIKTALLILVLAFTAHAQPLPRWAANTHLQIVASGFSDKERMRIDSAIKKWRPLLMNGLTIDLVGNAGNVSIVREATKGDELGETTILHTNGVAQSASIRIDPRAGSDDDFQLVVEHEIGHLLGLPHRPKSVMQKRARDSFRVLFWEFKGKTYHPDEQDRAELALLYPPLISRPVAVAVASTELLAPPSPVLQSEPPPVPILATVASQRYAFRRIVTIRDDSGVRVVRSSTFTFNDRNEQIETDVIQTGTMKGVNDAYWKRFPSFPICVIQPLSAFNTGLRAPPDYYVSWVDEDSDVSIGSKSGERFRSDDLPWFAEKVPSGLTFPIYAESQDGRVFVRFYNYRLFRTVVVVKHLDYVH